MKTKDLAEGDLENKELSKVDLENKGLSSFWQRGNAITKGRLVSAEAVVDAKKINAFPS